MRNNFHSIQIELRDIQEALILFISVRTVKHTLDYQKNFGRNLKIKVSVY